MDKISDSEGKKIFAHLNKFCWISRSYKIKKPEMFYLIQNNTAEFFKGLDVTYTFMNIVSSIGMIIAPKLISQTRYMVGIINFYDVKHGNALFIDTWLKTAERFEPHGSDVKIYNNSLLDQQLKKYFLDLDYMYISPTLFMQSSGPQAFDLHTKDNIGLCKIWSLIYIIIRLAEPDIELQKLSYYLTIWSKKYQKQHKSIQLMRTMAAICIPKLKLLVSI